MNVNQDEDGTMKIGITCYPTYGGSGAIATELGLGLARRGHEGHFMTRSLIKNRRSRRIKRC
ncbi:MAG: hypothetical protein F4012_06700, partial [Gemmatimonadales bacterium]|nr:hypothetical protein [Gemmatimonadales bacterium]